MNLGIYYTYLVNGAALIFRHTISDIYIRGTLFPQFLNFILFGPPKRCIIISHSQKIFQIYFTISVESSITFLNLVQAVLTWAVGRSKTGNRTLYEMPRAKSKYVP